MRGIAKLCDRWEGSQVTTPGGSLGAENAGVYRVLAPL